MPRTEVGYKTSNRMKNIKLLLIGLIAAFALTACGSSSNDDPEPKPSGSGEVTGEWHMISWSSLTAADIWLSIDKNGTFNLYQRVYSPQYVHLAGTYALTESTLSGRYSDNVAWGSSYQVSFYENGSQMVLTSTANGGDVSVFVKAAIPEEIKNGSLSASALQSRTGEEQPRFL